MILSKRSIVVGALVLLPLLFYVALGTYAMWSTGLFWWSWIFLPICWLLSWSVAKLWKPKTLDQQIESPSGQHFTARDQAAAEIVRQHQQRVSQYSPQQLTDPHFYLDVVKRLATDLAGHYHPKAKDPYSSLKVTEVLAAVRLAVDDLESMAIRSIPGSRLLTIGQWKALQHAPKWIRRIQDSVWVSSILLNPANLVRYYTSKATIDPLTNEIQAELLAMIYLRFIRQVGYYLIEMNSGRLRGGADAYRQVFGKGVNEGTPLPGRRAEDLTTSAQRSITLEDVAVVMVGQVSSGKSSLINALLGQEAAKSDVLPTTRMVQRYQFPLQGTDAKVQLLDTPGYGEAGASSAQLSEIQSALRLADAMILVLDAHSPARKADQQTLQQIHQYYQDNPHLKEPKVLAVLTHVDLLKPMMEWAPPYQWRTSQDLKSQNIRQAVAYTEEVLEQELSGVVPVCLSEKPERRWGMREEVLPALTQLLPDAKSASILRAYEKELDRDRWKDLLGQIKASGQELARFWWETRLERQKHGNQSPD